MKYVLYKIYPIVSKWGLLMALLVSSASLSANQLLTDSLSPNPKDSIYTLFFAQKNKQNIVEAIGNERGESLQAVPISSIGNALSGRIAGLSILQSTGEPGNDAPTLTVRGRQPLILVDGFPRNIYGVLPEHVESVTVLKDALATAALGVRGANGAILVTTRKEARQEGYNIDLTFQSGVTQPIGQREALPAHQYAALYNEARVNDGLAPLYSEEDLEAYRSGSSPYLYPNNNWQSLLLENQAPYQRYVLNADGKSDYVSYFISGDYLDQNGLLRQDNAGDSTNLSFKRFGFRGNVAVQVDSRTKLSLNLYGVSQRRTAPGGAASFSFAPNESRLSFSTGLVNSLFTDILNTPANAYPVYNPNGTLGGNQLFTNNLWGLSTQRGYTVTNANEGFVDLVLRREMDDVWEGWWVQGTTSYTMEIIHSLSRIWPNFPTYEMNINPITNDTTYRQFGQRGDFTSGSGVNVRNGSFFFDAATGQSLHWNDHTLDIQLQYQYNSARYSSQLPFIVQNGIARAQYRISDKYLFDAVASYSGNNWFKPGKRYALYPAVGLGWNIHNEAFFNQLRKKVDLLKLRASYGLTGHIDAAYFGYLYTYQTYGSAYYFGTAAGAVQGVRESTLPNVRKPEKALKFNVGMDMELFGNRAKLSVDYYNDFLYDLLQVRGNNTALLGGPYPAENLGKQRFSGIEATAGWADQIGKLRYFLNGNIALQNNRIVFNDQPELPYAWMGTVGTRLERNYGYIADGFVTAPGDGPVIEGYRSQPGDLKYKDLNGDGVVNFYDQTVIGPDKPLVYYGFEAGFSVGRFDLAARFSGMANRVVSLTGVGEWEFLDNGNAAAFPHHFGRWTPETASTATYPRLTAGNNPNNHVMSTFWLGSGDFMRLKTLMVGYTFSNKALRHLRIKELRVFGSGYNLFTFTGTDRFDPESLSRQYPLQRIFNGGLTIKF